MLLALRRVGIKLGSSSNRAEDAWVTKMIVRARKARQASVYGGVQVTLVRFFCSTSCINPRQRHGFFGEKREKRFTPRTHFAARLSRAGGESLVAGELHGRASGSKKGGSGSHLIARRQWRDRYTSHGTGEDA